MRQRGEDVFFLTGTDEHGSKVARSAAAAGLSPKEFCDQISARVPAARARSARDQRLLHPHLRPGARGVRAGLRRAHARIGRRLRGHLLGPVLHARARPSTRRTSSSTAMCPIHGTPPEWVEEKNWFFRLSSYEERLSALYDDRPEFVLPRAALQRGAGVHRRRPGGPLALARLDRVGRARAVGARPGDLRLDRRAHQLRSALTYARPGEDLDRPVLAGPLAAAGQGHPQVPRGDLAGDADERRLRAAAAAAHPRLPHGARGQDVEVRRQRARPVPGDRALRARRAALLPVPGRAVRQRRRRLVRARPRSLQPRARERPRQPPVAHGGHGRALPGRRGAVRARSTPGSARCSSDPRRASPRTSTGSS